MASSNATSYSIRTVSRQVAITISIELMIRMLVKVSVALITELISGPLLGVERDTLATLDLFLDSIVGMLLLLELKVPVRAGA